MIASFRVTLLLRSKVWFPSKLIRKGIVDSLSPSCLGHHRSTRKMERCIRPITRYLVEMVGRAKLWRKDNIADILCVDHMKFFSQLIFSTIILIYLVIFRLSPCLDSEYHNWIEPSLLMRAFSRSLEDTSGLSSFVKYTLWNLWYYEQFQEHFCKHLLYKQ